MDQLKGFFNNLKNANKLWYVIIMFIIGIVLSIMNPGW